jgi:hypothetical protein
MKEALEYPDPKIFIDFLSALRKNFNAYLAALVKSHPRSLIPYKEIFGGELAAYPSTSDRQFSEIEIFHSFKEIDNLFEDGKILNAFHRKKIFEKAFFCASKEEYEFFLQILKQEWPAELADKVYEIIAEGRFLGEFRGYFFKEKNPWSFADSSSPLFAEEDSVEAFFFSREDPAIYANFKAVAFEYDPETAEKKRILDKEDFAIAKQIYDQINPKKPHHPFQKGESRIYIFDGPKIIAKASDFAKKISIAGEWKDLRRAPEHVFYLLLADHKPKAAFFADSSQARWNEIKIIAKGSDIKEEIISTSAPWEIVPFVIFADKYGMIKFSDIPDKIIGKIADLSEIDPGERDFPVIKFRDSVNVFRG